MRATPSSGRWHLAAVAALTLIALTALLAGCAAPPDPTPVVTIPQDALPTPNAFDYDVKAGATLVDRDKIDAAISAPSGSRGAAETPTYTLAQKEQLVRENAGVLRLVRAGFQFPFLSPQVRAEDSNLSYYPKIRVIARLLKLEGQVEEAHGDWGAAVNTDLDAVRLGEDLPHGALEIGWLVGLSCQAIGRRPIWALIPHLTAPQARAAARRLAAIEARHAPFYSVMQQEEWTGQARLLAIFAKPDWRQALTDDDIRGAGIVDSPSSEVHSLLSLGLSQTTKKAEFDKFTRYWEELVRSARAPYASHVPVKHMPLDTTDMLTYYTFHNDPYKPPQFKDVVNQTQNELLMTTLGLSAYRLERGRPPLTLSTLVPNYLSKVPADPFALSGPLHYRPTGNQYVLYSIGPDGRDDHGKAIYDPSKPAPLRPGDANERYGVLETSRGDIVAGINPF